MTKRPAKPGPGFNAVICVENDRTLAASVAPVDDTLASDAGAGGSARSGDASDYDDLITVETGHYSIERELARGGMGRIFSARDRRLGRRVAIKELLVNEPGLEVRFEREARITARLQHPAIVNVHEAGRWKTGAPFFVMQLVTGKPLDQVIAKTTSLPERLALLPNVIAVVDALAYAHSERVIHRDLKPSNVLVGEYGETVVIDWGLAKDLLSTSEVEPAGPYRTPVASGGETVVGSILGTPAYMPPEQASGDKVDERADVYSLGAMLYHVLAGVPPYLGRNADELLDKVIAGNLTSLAKRVPEVPADLAAIVDKAMSRDAGDRFATANELATELKRFQTGQLVSVHRYSTTEILGRWVRKHRAAVATGTILAAALAVTATVSVRKILHARDVADDQRARALEEQGRQELVANRPNRALAYLDEAAAIGLSEPSLDLLRERSRAAVADIEHVVTADSAIEVLATDAAGDVIAVTSHGDKRGFTSTGAPIALPKMDEDDTFRMAPDGSQVAVKGDHITVYDLHTGVLRSELRDAGELLAVGHDRIATRHDSTAVLWDTTSNPARKVAEQDGVVVAMLTPWQGRNALVVLAGDGRKLRAIDTATGSEIQTLDVYEPNTETETMDLMSSGWLLAPSKGEESTLDSGHVYSIHGIDMHTSGKTIDVEMRLSSLVGETIAPHGELVAGWGPDGLTIVDPAKHRTITDVKIPKPDSVEPLEIDGRAAFAVLSAGVVSIYDGYTGLRTHVLDGHTGKITTLAGTGDGIHFVTGGDDGRIVTWAPHGRLAMATRNHAASIAPGGDRMAIIENGRASLSGTSSVDFDVADVRTLDVAWSQGRAALVDEAGTVSIASFAGKPTTRIDAATQMAMFDTTGDRLATIDRHGAKLWRADGTLLATLAGQRDIVSLARWSPDGHLITAGDDGQLVRWGSDGSRRILEDGHGSIAALAVSARWIGVGSGDGWVHVYGADGSEVFRLVGHGEAATAIAISPDESIIASGGADGRIRLWTLPDGAPLGVLEHGDVVHSLAFTGDSAILASGTDASDTGNVKLWNARGGVLLDTIAQPGTVRFADNDRAIAIRGVKGSAVWRMPTQTPHESASIWRVDNGRLVQRHATALLPPPAKSRSYDFTATVADYSEHTGPAVSVPLPTTDDERTLATVAEQLSHGQLRAAAAQTAHLDGTSLARGDALLTLAYARDAADDDAAALRWATAALAKHAPGALEAVAKFASHTTTPVADVVAIIGDAPRGLVGLAARYVEVGRLTDAGSALDASIAARRDVVAAYLAKARLAILRDHTGDVVAAFDGAVRASSDTDRVALGSALDDEIKSMHASALRRHSQRHGDATRALVAIQARLGTTLSSAQRDYNNFVDSTLSTNTKISTTLPNKGDIQRVVKGRLSEVLDCYDRATLATGPIAGTMQLELTIDVTGSVDGVKASAMGNSQLEHCVVERISRWHFDPGARVVVTYPIAFKTGT